jgi:heme exporter protein C
LGFAAACWALIAVAGYAIFFLAPQERTMGAIQRIFYFHVASAWVSFLAFFLVFVAGIVYLATRGPRWDWLGLAAAEVGLAFTSVVLVTGPIWAKPVWGIWWTWDARLTSTFVLWLLYMTYLLLRTLVVEPGRRAVFCAVFGIFAFLDVPLVYVSIRIWRTQHPQPVVGGGEGSGLDAVMWRILLLTVTALVALMVLLIHQRYRLESLRHQIAELAEEAESQPAPVESAPGSAPRGSAALKSEAEPY